MAGSQQPNPSPVLKVQDLAVSFDNLGGPRLQAVDGVRMVLYPGQTLAVVGESGCGKSVTALSSLQLIPRPPGRFDRGKVLFQTSSRLGWGEVDLLTLDADRMRQIRGSEIAMIFQEPMTSLNPVYSIGDQIIEAIRLHQNVSQAEARNVAIEAMTDVGIPDPARRLKAYPHQFSGGMRQRVMIAIALACNPRVLLADEPTTALDVTIQAQILDLLGELKAARGLGIMLITHDLGVVAEQSDVVCVMYAGRVVEYARVDELFASPLHPYTRGLLACIPKMNERQDRLVTVKEVTEDRAQFAGIAGLKAGLRPWWPWHEAPEDAVRSGGPAGDYALVRVADEHWIGVWRTPAVEPADETFPDLAPKPAAAAVGASSPAGG